MQTVHPFRRFLPIAFLLIGAAGCENHAIPNKVDKADNVPAETYESAPPPGDVEADPEVAARFPGGNMALRRWLAENMSYPQSAVELGIEGKVYLQFVIDKNGYVNNVRVVRGVPDCPECDREAVRVVRSMPRWTPGRSNNKPVSSTFNLPISFQQQ